jgi:prepilin signal peptidase PulO-like enzyme (type II secretory pathway)
MLLHKYCGIFGKPNEGVHKYRLFGMGLVDLIGTLLLAIILKLFINKLKDENIIILFLVIFAIGQVLHFLFGVNTAFINFIGFEFSQCK